MTSLDGDEAENQRNAVLAELLRVRDDLALIHWDAELAELLGTGAPLRILLVTASRDVSPGPLRARIARLVKSVRRGKVRAHIVVVGGTEAARRALTLAAPVQDLASLGFHHLDATGALTHVKGAALPALGEAHAHLAALDASSRDTPYRQAPLGPADLADALARGRAVVEESRKMAARLRGRRGVTVAIMVAWVLLFGLSHAFGPGGDNATLWRMGGTSGDAVRQGELWRLFASSFLHGSPVHLALDMAALWMLGPTLESLLGARRFVLLYGAAALGGAIASSFVANRWSVGPGGALFGLMTAAAGTDLRSRGILPWQSRGILPWQVMTEMRARMWVMLAASLAIGFMPGRDMAAALGGAAVGLVLAATVLTRSLKPVAEREGVADAEARPRPFLTAGAALMGAAMALSVAVALAVGRPWDAPLGPPAEPKPITEPTSTAPTRERDAGAAELYQKMCDEGRAEGCNSLGLMYDEGTGVAKDAARAAQLYQKSCEGGHAAGCNSLGLMYASGRGVAESWARAAQLYEKACEGGEMTACDNLAFDHQHGKGVAKDAARAAQLYQKSCNGGHVGGCDHLAWMARNGRGVPKDEARAAELYQKICDEGHADGCASLASMVEQGQGVPKNAARAMELYGKSCDGGAAYACRHLGRGEAKDTACGAQVHDGGG